jgi:hypothetical protein
MDQAIGLGWGARKWLSLLMLACAVHLRRSLRRQEVFREMGIWASSSSGRRILSKSGGAPGNPRAVGRGCGRCLRSDEHTPVRHTSDQGGWEIASGDVHGCVWSRAILSVAMTGAWNCRRPDWLGLLLAPANEWDVRRISAAS